MQSTNKMLVKMLLILAKEPRNKAAAQITGWNTIFADYSSDKVLI